MSIDLGQFQNIISNLGIDRNPNISFAYNTKGDMFAEHAPGKNGGQIVFDPTILKGMTNPAASAMLAHEYGHLVLPQKQFKPGYTWTPVAISGQQTFGNYTQQQREKQADAYAMNLLAQYKVPIADLLSPGKMDMMGINQMSALNPLMTHPNDADRIAAWRQQAMSPQILTLLMGRGADRL